MKRKFAVGDIQGCLRTLDALLDKIGLTTEDEIIFLGDYVDRGPDSLGVLNRLARLKLNRYQVKMLRGNHEQMLLDSYKYSIERNELSLGDPQLLDSFGITSLQQIPIEYIDFMSNLPFYHLSDNYILVHAGLNFKLGDDPLRNEEDMMWMRHWYNQIDRNWLGNRIVIHGHTPQTKMDTMAQLENLDKLPVLDIDCGIYLRSKLYKGFGHLCAFDMTNQMLYFQENVDEDCIY